MNLEDAGLTHEHEQRAGLGVQVMDAIGEYDTNNLLVH